MNLVTIQTNSSQNISAFDFETNLKFGFTSVLSRMSDEDFLGFSRRNESWLIDPNLKQFPVYRSNPDVEIFENPANVCGEDFMTGFVLNLAEIRQ